MQFIKFFFFSLMNCAFVVCKKSFINPRSLRIILYNFFCKFYSFRFYYNLFRSVIYLELVFLHGVIYGSNFSFLPMHIQLVQQYLLTKLSFLWITSAYLLKTFFFWCELFFFFFLNFWILFTFLYSRFLLIIHFIHISVYMSIPISQFIPPPTPPPRHFPPVGVHTFVLYICVSVSALQTGELNFLFYICLNLVDLFFYLVPVPHYPDNCSFIINHKIR